MGRPRRSRRFAGAEDEPPAPRARPDDNPHNPDVSTLLEAAQHVRQAVDILARAARAAPGAHWRAEMDRLHDSVLAVEQEILTDAELLEAEV